jgi:ERCC4-type nuclease
MQVSRMLSNRRLLNLLEGSLQNLKIYQIHWNAKVTKSICTLIVFTLCLINLDSTAQTQKLIDMPNWIWILYFQKLYIFLHLVQTC